MASNWKINIFYISRWKRYSPIGCGSGGGSDGDGDTDGNDIDNSDGDEEKVNKSSSKSFFNISSLAIIH